MHTEEITKMVEQFRQEEKGGSQLNWWESISQHGEPWGCINIIIVLTICENRGSWCFQSLWETRRPMMTMMKVTKWYNKWEIMKLLMTKMSIENPNAENQCYFNKPLAIVDSDQSSKLSKDHPVCKA